MAEYGYVSDSDSCDEPTAIVVEEVTPEEKDVAGTKHIPLFVSNAINCHLLLDHEVECMKIE